MRTVGFADLEFSIEVSLHKEGMRERERDLPFVSDSYIHWFVEFAGDKEATEVKGKSCVDIFVILQKRV